MKKLNLRTKTQRKYLEIPVDFIDEYMPQAPEGALKLYLYLLRSALDPSILLSLSDMADLFDMTQKAVIRSLTYWEECGLLTLEYHADDLTDITILPFPSEKSLPEETLPQEPSVPEEPSNIHALPVRPDAARDFSASSSPAPRETASPAAAVSPAELSDLDRDGNFTDLLDLAQYYLKKPASSTLRDALGYCYLLYDRQNDIIEYLLEYCIDLGKTSPYYIRTVAENWKKEGLLNLEEIKKDRSARSRTLQGIQNAFGIRDRALGKVEMDYIESWSRDFDLPIILEACNRTMKNAHSPSFGYANRILSDWKEEKVSSLEDIRKLDEAHAKKDRKASGKTDKKGAGTGSFRNFEERKDDYSDLIRNYYES